MNLRTRLRVASAIGERLLGRFIRSLRLRLYNGLRDSNITQVCVGNQNRKYLRPRWGLLLRWPNSYWRCGTPTGTQGQRNRSSNCSLNLVLQITENGRQSDSIGSIEIGNRTPGGVGLTM